MRWPGWVDCAFRVVHLVLVIGEFVSGSTLKSVRNCRLDGEVLVRTYQGDHGEVACLYGDPEGLRSLAAFLIAVADLDQEELLHSQLPIGEGFHAHLKPGAALCDESLQLDVGRLDARATGDTSWYKFG